MFTDFAYYTSHGGILSESQYNTYAPMAYYEIISQTNHKAASAPDCMTEAVKMCEVALIDVLAGYGEASSSIPAGVSSVNNDGFSISRGSSFGGSAIELETAAANDVCARYLQTPINLMCRWL